LADFLILCIYKTRCNLWLICQKDRKNIIKDLADKLERHGLISGVFVGAGFFVAVGGGGGGCVGLGTGVLVGLGFGLSVGVLVGGT